MKCLFMLPFRYKSAVRFSIGSTAELLETDLVVARYNRTVRVVTPFDVKEPMLELSPGKGVKCGQLVCHKYASCSVKFVNGEEAKCNCPPGFSGILKNYFQVYSWSHESLMLRGWCWWMQSWGAQLLWASSCLWLQIAWLWSSCSMPIPASNQLLCLHLWRRIWGIK